MSPTSKWLTWCALAFVSLGVWGVVNTPASLALEPGPLQVLSTICLVPVTLLLLFSKNWRQSRNLRRGAIYAFTGGLLASVGNMAISAAITSGGQTSIVLPLSSVFPLVTAILARFVLKERLSSIQLVGLLLALGALVLSGLVSAGETPPALAALPWWRKAFSLWMLYGLAALLTLGISAIFQKLCVGDISAELSTLFFTAGFVVVSIAIVLVQPGFTLRVSAHAWMLALAYGVLIAAQVLTCLAAYRWGKASSTTAITALYPALTVVLAVPLLGDRLDGVKVAMIVLALAAGVALAQEEKEEKEADGPRPDSVVATAPTAS